MSLFRQCIASTWVSHHLSASRAALLACWRPRSPSSFSEIAVGSIPQARWSQMSRPVTVKVRFLSSKAQQNSTGCSIFSEGCNRGLQHTETPQKKTLVLRPWPSNAWRPGGCRRARGGRVAARVLARSRGAGPRHRPSDPLPLPAVLPGSPPLQGQR